MNTIPRGARTVFKNHCDHILGVVDALSQMGGCPSAFVGNAVVNSMATAWQLHGNCMARAGASTPSS